MHYIIVAICITFLCACEPMSSEESALQGSIQRMITSKYERITYRTAQNYDLDRIETTYWDNQPFYRILEQKEGTWQDVRPIQCLLVGIDSYANDPLLFCTEDIRLFQLYIQKHFVEFQQKCSFQILLEKEATKASVIEALSLQTKQSTLFSTTIFVFSGHGDESGIQLYDSCITREELQAFFLQNLSTRLIWILDACRSGNFTENLQYEFSPRKIKPVGQRHTLYPTGQANSYAHVFLGQGKVILFASQANEEARDGIFLRSLTYHLKAIDTPISCLQLAERVQTGIAYYNQYCLPEKRYSMTPYALIYGDIRVWVMPWLVKYTKN